MDMPLGGKAYTSIPHLPGSKKDSSDRMIGQGCARILTEAARPGDRIIVTEKLDGSCVAVAKTRGQVIPVTRSGQRAGRSKWKHHRIFDGWVMERYALFDALLQEGERLCGEWMARTHGIRYRLSDPFWAFDLFYQGERLPHEALETRCARSVPIVPVLYDGPEAVSVDRALTLLGPHGRAGALDAPEGCVWRVERAGRACFLAKYVRPDFEPGKYLDARRWNWSPS